MRKPFFFVLAVALALAVSYTTVRAADEPMPAVGQAAHTLMGSCSNFGAKPLQDLSAQLESLARSPDYLDSPDAESRAGELLDAIRGELERVATALGAYRKKL